jgi:hypothetical protein
MREYGALRKQFNNAREFQIGMLAAIRADIHNTAGKSFEHQFRAEDFMPGAKSASIEDRVHELIKQGYTPAEAAAMATSKQSREEKQNIIQTITDKANRLKRKQRAG